LLAEDFELPHDVQMIADSATSAAKGRPRRLEAESDESFDDLFVSGSVAVPLSGRRLKEKKKRIAGGSDEARCLYGDSNQYTLLPSVNIKDQMIADEKTAKKDKPRRRPALIDKSDEFSQLRGNRTACPDSTMPTPEHPFMFFYGLHTNGEALRRFFADTAINLGVPAAIPGFGNLSSTCSLEWSATPAQVASCSGSDPNFMKASIFHGIISPLRLDHLHVGTCFVMMRNPLNRLHTHYSASRIAEKFGGKALHELTHNETYLVMDAVGGSQYMSKHLGCKAQDCEYKNAREVLESARGELQRCHVGVADNHRETTSYLVMLLPWFDPGTLKILDNDGSMEMQRMSLSDFKKDVRLHLKSLLAADIFLFDDAINMFYKQMRGAISCYTHEKYMGDEAAISRELKKIARRVMRRTMKDRQDMSQCLERRKLCQSHDDIDQRSCRCSEFADFRED
jgi:hypothetical protein